MAKSKQNRHRDSRRPLTEGAGAEFVTVGWMLSVVTTLVCELLLIATRLYIALASPQNQFLLALVAILSLAALVVGTVSLLLAAVVVRVRRTQPPRGLLMFSLVIGAMPITALLLSMLANR